MFQNGVILRNCIMRDRRTLSLHKVFQRGLTITFICKRVIVAWFWVISLKMCETCVVRESIFATADISLRPAFCQVSLSANNCRSQMYTKTIYLHVGGAFYILSSVNVSKFTNLSRIFAPEHYSTARLHFGTSIENCQHEVRLKGHFVPLGAVEFFSMTPIWNGLQKWR